MAAQLSSSCLINPNHQLPTYTHTALLNTNTTPDNNICAPTQLYANQYHCNDHYDNIATLDNSNNHTNSLDSCSLDNLQHDDHPSHGQLQQQLDQSMDCHSQLHINTKCINTIVMGQDEYESKSSSDNPEEFDQADGRPNKKRYHRHSQRQIQEMERVFKECPHPDEKQRLELSRDLKLDPRQVKFWFQNKRTQVKAQHERHDNAYLRAENEKLRAENLALRDAIANVTCPACGGPAALADVSFDEQQLRVENVRLREEIDRISKIAAKHVGRPISILNIGSTLTSPTSTTTSTLYLPTNQGTLNNASNELGENEVSNMQSSLISNYKPMKLLDTEKPMVVELAMSALEELMQLSQATEPLWKVDPLTGMEVLDHEQYVQTFPHDDQMLHHINLSNFTRQESTKDTALIMMDATSLVDIFMNVTTWADMFCPIVSRALPVEVLCPSTTNNQDGAMQIIYAEFHIPTPIVATRESYFLRYAKNMSSHNNPAMWVLVDVSIESLGPRINVSPSRCRRRPSGCIIEQLSNGYSKVTWVEHTELDEYKGVHRLYEQLVTSGMAFGAQRWLSILQRQCESIQATNAAMASPTKDLVSPTLEGRRSLLKLTERMTNSFCGGVSASVAHTWITLAAPGGVESEGGLGSKLLRTSGEENGASRVLIRKSVDDPGRPPGVVLCAATSMWLHCPPSRVFHFLRDQTLRTEWDILSNMGAVEEIMHVSKGHNTGNNVTLLRVNATSSNQPNMLILQECRAEETAYMVVYAPVDIAAMSTVINGGDPDCVALLPSGFSILPDRPCPRGNADTPTGSLLTVAFQILVDHVPTAKLSLGSVATVHNLITSTVLRIKNALACDSTACIS